MIDVALRLMLYAALAISAAVGCAFVVFGVVALRQSSRFEQADRERDA